MTHSAEKDVPTFGQPVEFTRTLTRRYEHHAEGHKGMKVWKSEGYPGEPEPAPRTGVLVGVRTLSNGENHYHGYDEPIEYRPTETFAAYLIAYDLRRKPVLVLPEHTRPLPPDSGDSQ